MQNKYLRTFAGAVEATLLKAETNINPIDAHLDLLQGFRNKDIEDQGRGRWRRPLINFGTVVVFLLPWR